MNFKQLMGIISFFSCITLSCFGTAVDTKTTSEIEKLSNKISDIEKKFTRYVAVQIEIQGIDDQIKQANVLLENARKSNNPTLQRYVNRKIGDYQRTIKQLKKELVELFDVTLP